LFFFADDESAAMLRRTFAERHIFNAITSALSTMIGDASLVAAAAGAVHALTWGGSAAAEQRKVAVTAGVIPALVSGMRAQASHSGVAKAGSWALATLSGACTMPHVHSTLFVVLC
jgi:hypothetical protein